jgi:hypothetical protein
MRYVRSAAAVATVVLVGALTVTVASAGDTPQAVALAPATGTYYPLAPARVLDTRFGIGVPAGKVGPNTTITVQVAGAGGVPATGASAVMLNVTAEGSTGNSFVAVYPSGIARPLVSNLNFPPNFTGANAVTVPLGSDGRVALYNAVGSVSLIADVVGFYAADDSVVPAFGTSGGYFPLQPGRYWDSREDVPLDPGGWIKLSFGFADPTVAPHIRAIAVNLTAVSGNRPGYLATWNGVESALPSTSTLNFGPFQAVSNLAIIPTANCDFPGCEPTDKMFGVFNGSSGANHFIVDILGMYVDESFDAAFAPSLRFRPLTPTRIVDSRIGQGTPSALGPGVTRTIVTPSALVTNDTFALATNVTAVAPTAYTFLTLWPNYAGVPQPLVSTISPAPGQVIPNAALVEIAEAFDFNIFNAAGTCNVLVDVSGAFDLPPAAAANGTQSKSEGRTYSPKRFEQGEVKADHGG